MYKVIYQKHDGRVVGCYPFEIKTRTAYIFKDEDVEFEIPEIALANYESSKIERIEKQEENAKFFYDKETCEAVDFESVPEYGKNQYLVYDNGNIVVKNIIQDYKPLARKYIHEKYDYDKQLEVLREKDIDPEQFNEFNDYVINCIERAKAETNYKEGNYE